MLRFRNFDLLSTQVINLQQNVITQYKSKCRLNRYDIISYLLCIGPLCASLLGDDRANCSRVPGRR